MYNPCRGGVRGGADQFTWESVKTDKHRENYLGHSLKAPVGRWQKGKDLSWYAKERKNEEEAVKRDRSEMLSIKKAEEEAMLIALGHKVVRKESHQDLSKEEMTEALKRNIGDRDDLSIERIDGVGATSRRAALMTGVSKNSSSKNEGVVFESQRERNTEIDNSEEHSPSYKREKSKKKSKKRKKEKKKKHSQESSGSEESETEFNSRKKHKKHKRENDSHRNATPDASETKKTNRKKSKHKHHNSSDSDSNYQRTSKSKMREKYRTHHDSPPRKRHRHDTSESD